MIVNAFLTKCLVLSQRCAIRFLNCGAWYAGSSIINGGVSPFKVVLRIKSTETIAAIMPRRYIEKVIRSALPISKYATIAPATAVNIGSLAPHEKKGITLIVAVRSLSSASVLVFIIAGTEQPKPIIIGRKALPDSPKRRNILSRINAILAI